MCGHIVGIALDHPGDPMPMDWLGQPQCGLTIIQTSRMTDASGTTIWKGVVLDPRNGEVHPAQIAFDAFRNMLLRGYAFLPIFGETQTWKPYPGTTLPNCHLG